MVPMNKKILLTICLALVSVSAHARIQKETFNAGEQLTAGKLFLNQVDAVSLYLSTQRIVYVPRLTDDMRLGMSLTLLGEKLTANRAQMQELVTRHINTFNKTLMERLQYYTPQLAGEFKPMEDVEFVIQTGSGKKAVATWKGGEWKWLTASVGTAAPVAAQIEEVAAPQPQKNGKDSCKKRCPALIGVDQPADQPAEAMPPQKPEENNVNTESAEAPRPAARYGVGQ
ncbi:MAG: hypothetical protein Q8P84_04660 [Deltaproteobacteria bacterium]|nr:hypothetical protein [Deltaproteobacteria bacterium]